MNQVFHKIYFSPLIILLLFFILIGCTKNNNIPNEGDTRVAEVKFRFNNPSVANNVAQMGKSSKLNASVPKQNVLIADGTRVHIGVYEKSTQMFVKKVEVIKGREDELVLMLDVGVEYIFVAFTDNVLTSYDANYTKPFVFQGDGFHSLIYPSTNDLQRHYIIGRKYEVNDEDIYSSFPTHKPYYYCKIVDFGYLTRSNIINLDLQQINFGINVTLDFSESEFDTFMVQGGVKLESDSLFSSNFGFINLDKGEIRSGWYGYPYQNRFPSLDDFSLLLTDDRLPSSIINTSSTIQFTCFSYATGVGYDLNGELRFRLVMNNSLNPSSELIKDFSVKRLPFINGTRYSLRLKLAPGGELIISSPTLDYEILDTEILNYNW